MLNARTVLRAAYMPPLRIDQTPSQHKNVTMGADGRGGVKTPPYNIRQTPYNP